MIRGILGANLIVGEKFSDQGQKVFLCRKEGSLKDSAFLCFFLEVCFSCVSFYSCFVCFLVSRVLLFGSI